MAFDFEKFGTPVKTNAPATGTGFNFDTFGQEAAPAKKKRSTLGKVAEFVAPTALHTVEKLQRGEQIEGKDIVGSALEVGSFVVPAGAGARALGLAGKGAMALRGAGMAGKIADSAIVGGTSGALHEAGGAVGEGAGAAEIASRTLTGGAFGTAAGVALPPAIAGVVRGAGAIRGGFAARAARKTAEEVEEKALLADKTPDSRVATKALSEEGKVVTDPKAAETVRQGVDPADVALIKTGTKTDIEKMKTMLDTRVKQLTNKRLTNRATDVVGDTFVEKIAKPLAEKNREAGKALNLVAQRLAGQKADPMEAVTQFATDLDTKGVKVGKDGKLNFKGSDFEGLRGPQVLIENVWRRALKAAKSKDALQIHRTKSYIDEIVDYGKSAEGLSGKAQNLLKGFRHNIDKVLDQKFPAYNAANTQFAETINELDKIASAMGRKWRVGDSFADARAGLVMRSILSNTKSRSDVLQLLESSQAILKKMGIELDEDVITQANFADTLERLLGSEAPTSFLGQVERGTKHVEDAIAIGGDVMQGSFGKAAMKGVKKVIDEVRGIDRESQIQALRDLLESLSPTKKPTTNFGKKTQ